MARAGLTPQIVTAHALAVLDETGPAGLTLKAVAERAGVAAPSLYKHVRSLDDLRLLMTVQVLNEAADRIGAGVMGLAGDDALRAFLREYRTFAGEFPYRHSLLEMPPVGGGQTDPALEAAAGRLLGTAYAAVRGYGLDGDELVHAVRALRAVVVGFVRLEQGTGFRLPTPLDASFDFLAELLTAGLGRLAARSGSAVGG